MEQASQNQIQTLHPKIRKVTLDAYNQSVLRTPNGVHPVITQGYRSFKESDELYAQGRTKPGSIISKSKAGQSYHNYGLAIDFSLLIDGKLNWNVDKNWMIVVNTFKEFGFTWGGDWKNFKDFPHLEMKFSYNWRDLLKLHNEGKVDENGYVLI